jgi:hypothetical protein
MNFKSWLLQEDSYDHIAKLAKKANLDISKFSKKEIIDGFRTEQEHDTNDSIDVVKEPVTALKIALAHLREDPNYYKKLKKAGL